MAKEPQPDPGDLLTLAKRAMVDAGFDIELDAADREALAAVRDQLQNVETRKDL